MLLLFTLRRNINADIKPHLCVARFLTVPMKLMLLANIEYFFGQAASTSNRSQRPLPGKEVDHQMCQLICCPTISLTLLVSPIDNRTLWPQTKLRHRLPRHIWQRQSQKEHSHTKHFEHNTHKVLRYTFPARSTARLRITFFFCVVQCHSLRAYN